MGEMGSILLQYYPYIGEVIYIFSPFSFLKFRLTGKFNFSFVFDGKLFEKIFKTQTEDVKSLHNLSSSRLQFFLLTFLFERLGGSFFFDFRGVAMLSLLLLSLLSHPIPCAELSKLFFGII